jgi:hypothetical protein
MRQDQNFTAKAISSFSYKNKDGSLSEKAVLFFRTKNHLKAE